MNMITVKQATLSDHARWDEFVENHPDASPYHLSAWLKAVETAYQHRCFYLIAEQENTLIGILPLVIIKPPLLSGSLCSLPFCDVGGVLSHNEQAAAELLKAATAIAQQHTSGKMALRASAPVSTEPAPDSKPDPGSEAQNQKVRMLLNLPESAEQLFASFKAKLRSQVRKAEKNGISYRQANDQYALDAFYTVMQANMRLLGSPVHAKQWFEQIIHQYGDKAQIGLAEKDGLVIGAAIILLCGQTVTVPWASTLAEYNRLSPNMLLYWGLLSYAADNGYKRFDFGRSSIGEGTYRFKKQWGATPIALDWKEYDQQGLVTVSAAPGNSKLRPLIASTWAKLPEPITNKLGPIFRRYISL